MRGGTIVGIVAVALLMGALPIAAQTDETVSAREVVLEPVDGASILVDGREYTGTVTLSAHTGGIAFVEETDVDSYLLGIREVPFSWEPATLAAQAVAARTYLAWTLDRGRSSNGRRFDYDICATTACQVYAGVGGLDGPDGGDWVRAVMGTTGQLLVWEGAPVQALYSSTSDGRTRNVEDVFVGSSPLPYLRAVESPGETSPFVEWSFTLSAEQADAMFAHAGVADGPVADIRSVVTPDGTGPWTVTVVSEGDSVSIDTWTLRSRLNRAAADLFPDAFPAFRPRSARRYPQTVMSPNYTISAELVFVPPIDGPPRFERRWRLRGGGWGHLVGMSQYGAQAMAVAGADHVDILAHYYGGIEPTTDLALPSTIRVGIDTDATDIELRPTGPLRVSVDGEQVTAGELGTWVVTAADGLALVDPPSGLGLPPRIDAWRTSFDADGRPQLVTFRSRTAAELRVVVREAGVVIADTGVEVRDAGVVAVDISPASARSVVTVQVIARSPLGADIETLRLLGGAE